MWNDTRTNKTDISAKYGKSFTLAFSQEEFTHDQIDSIGHKEFMQLTLAIVCKALFSFDVESETKEIGKHVTTLVFQGIKRIAAGVITHRQLWL